MGRLELAKIGQNNSNTGGDVDESTALVSCILFLVICPDNYYLCCVLLFKLITV